MSNPTTSIPAAPVPGRSDAGPFAPTVSIAREVLVAAAPADVAAELADSRWRSALEIRPEGAGARVRILATAGPEPVAAALEHAILGDVCAAKARLEGG